MLSVINFFSLLSIANFLLVIWQSSSLLPDKSFAQATKLIHIVDSLEIICVLFMCPISLQLGINTVPVLIGPVSYLLLSKPAKGVEKSFALLSLLGKVLAVYK